MLTRDKKELFDMFLNEPSIEEDRCAAAHVYVNARDGLVSRDIAEDLGLWILYGSKNVTVRTQIQFTQYKADLEASRCVKA